MFLLPVAINSWSGSRTAGKSTAAVPDNEAPRGPDSKRSGRGNPPLADRVFAEFSEAPTLLRQGFGGFSSPSSPWQVYPPEAAPQATRATGYSAKENKLHLHLGEKEDILFVWIAPLSIWVSQYEVTNVQYSRFNRAHDPKRYYDHILNLPDQPAVMVSWEDANNYCGWLNRHFRGQLPPGFEFRLPTEKEWTAFAACGREVTYPWGDQWPPPDSLNYKGIEGASMFYGIFHNERFIRKHNDGFIVGAPVSKSGTNEWGLYGVGGNVWEWCQDWFDDTKTTRVLRGAAWNNYEPAILAISNRSALLPEKNNAMIGFRVVIAPSKK